MESEIERNAQDWFRFMVDTNLAPGLRALGFFGVGRRFRIESPQHWGEIAVEQSKSVFVFPWRQVGALVLIALAAVVLVAGLARRRRGVS